MNKKIFLVAGEVSGDIHASRLAREIKGIDPQIELEGVGGAMMAGEGVRIFYRTDEMGIIGLPDIFKHLSKIKEMLRFIPAKMEEDKVGLAILIDYPGFNLRLARELKRRGAKILYYVSPQVWAWGKGRIGTIKNTVDKILVLFKFETEIYENAGVNVEFTGHPLLDIARPSADRDALKNKFSLDKSKKTVSILPGSREREIRALLPVMAEAAERLYKQYKDLQFVVVKSYNLEDGLLKKYLDKFDVPYRLVENRYTELYDVLSVSDLAIAASGTVTLECAIMNVPMIITYKVSLLNALLMKLFIRVPSIGLVNVLAGRKIVPELIQFDFTCDKVFKEASKILFEPEVSSRIKAELIKVKESLGEKGAARRSAVSVINFLNNN